MYAFLSIFRKRHAVVLTYYRRLAYCLPTRSLSAFFVENCKRLVGGVADTEYGSPRCQPLGVGSKNRET